MRRKGGVETGKGEKKKTRRGIGKKKGVVRGKYRRGRERMREEEEKVGGRRGGK